MRKIKKSIWSFLNMLHLGGPIQLMLNGALIEDAWYKSFKSKQSIGKNGNPIPWYTYCFIKFLEPRLQKHFDVFEFGCGNSTVWYAERVNTIKSVEHDKNWLQKMEVKLLSNAEIIFKELKDEKYANVILEESKNFHVIVIDGRDRNNCTINAVQKLTKDGIIIFDNSQLLEYKDALVFLRSKGFKEIPFIGMLPIVAHNNTTSVFYREHNCLEI